MSEPYFSDDDPPWSPEDDEPHTVKVWVLESNHEQYEPFYVDNVYSSLEKAQASVVGAVWTDRDRSMGQSWFATVDAGDDEWGESVVYRITEKELL